MSEFNIQLILEYDGSGFHGWQKQPGLRTIQGELERVLKMVLRTDIGEIRAAGRTDAGVHALGQVANFHLDVASEPDLRRLSHAVSNLLKGEVSVLRAQFVPLDFDAALSARSKQYSYHILHRGPPAVHQRGKVWYVGCEIDYRVLEREAGAVIGLHDFVSFRGPDCTAKTSQREIFESEVRFNGRHIDYRIVGRGFLKQMVRNIVGTLIDLSRHRLALTSISEILAAQDRRMAGMTAPAHGLFLDWVSY